MRVLIIKTSSMGDLIHTLPALTDAGKAIPDIRFDWVAEESFTDIPAWHPLVENTIPVALRRWRRATLSGIKFGEIKRCWQQLRQHRYDLIIDAQGLLKSSVLGLCAKGPTHGLDQASAREGFASKLYQICHQVNPDQHAVTRTRQLFAQALGYRCPTTMADYDIDPERLPKAPITLPNNYVVCLHGTTWATKHWPEPYWHTLLNKFNNNNQTVFLPWGNAAEKNRAERLAKDFQHVLVLPKCRIAELATILHQAKMVIAVDTGLGHLSAALATPTISLYGPTDPAKVGTVGSNQTHLIAEFPCAPCQKKTCSYPYKNNFDDTIKPACFTKISPDHVWKQIQALTMGETV